MGSRSAALDTISLSVTHSQTKRLSFFDNKCDLKAWMQCPSMLDVQ